jgi:hypothetical protein
MAQAMPPRWGKANKEDQMSSQEPPEGEKPEVIDIVFGLPPSPRGAYRRERDDGTSSMAMRAENGRWTMKARSTTAGPHGYFPSAASASAESVASSAS